MSAFHRRAALGAHRVGLKERSWKRGGQKFGGTEASQKGQKRSPLCAFSRAFTSLSVDFAQWQSFRRTGARMKGQGRGEDRKKKRTKATFQCKSILPQGSLRCLFSRPRSNVLHQRRAFLRSCPPSPPSSTLGKWPTREEAGEGQILLKGQYTVNSLPTLFNISGKRIMIGRVRVCHV